jgi:hypothetical protein
MLPRPLNPLRNPWTQAELQTLIDHYPNGGTRRVSIRLPGRSKATIKMTAHKLGIRKGPYLGDSQDSVG